MDVYIDGWMGFTKNELPTDRRRKVTSDIDGFAPFFLSVREWQLAPPPPLRTRQRSSLPLGD